MSHADTKKAALGGCIRLFNSGLRNPALKLSARGHDTPKQIAFNGKNWKEKKGGYP